MDSDVIANAPVKFLVAGMGDALGTYFEARACERTDAPSLESGGITRSAMALCRLCYDTLKEYGAAAKKACECHVVTPAWRLLSKLTSTYPAWVQTTADWRLPTPSITA